MSIGSKQIAILFFQLCQKVASALAWSCDAQTLSAKLSCLIQSFHQFLGQNIPSVMNSFGKKVSHGMELLPLLLGSSKKKKIDH
jgi:hypothetical protein